MSTGSISDVLSQISSIESQLQQLQSGAMLDAVLGTTSGSSSSGSSGSSGTSASDFSDALAQAQTADTDTAASDTTADDTAASAAAASATATSDTASSAGGAYGSLLSSQLGTTAAAPTDTPTSADGTTALSSLTGSSGVSGNGVTLPASASSLLTAGQQQFASSLSADTGLNPGVVSAWLLSEESGSAAASRQSAGNNDWLNIGYTDSGTYGASDAVWSDPTTAASATAQWLQGQSSIAGYGTASSGIQSILSSVGQTPQAQITALQNSGWSSGGYPDLTSLYAQVST
jgi:hypothetical protein